VNDAYLVNGYTVLRGRLKANQCGMSLRELIQSMSESFDNAEHFHSTVRSEANLEGYVAFDVEAAGFVCVLHRRLGRDNDWGSRRQRLRSHGDCLNNLHRLTKFDRLDGSVTWISYRATIAAAKTCALDGTAAGRAPNCCRSAEASSDYDAGASLIRVRNRATEAGRLDNRLLTHRLGRICDHKSCFQVRLSTVFCGAEGNLRASDEGRFTGLGSSGAGAGFGAISLGASTGSGAGGGGTFTLGAGGMTTLGGAIGSTR
jgi:hypothetical protein